MTTRFLSAPRGGMPKRSAGMFRNSTRAIMAAVIAAATATAPAAPPPSHDEAAAALKRAVRYYRDEVSTRGGYLWRYAADLTERWGEGKATPSQIWVQPPGTPAVGMALLRAYERTKDVYYLRCAGEAAHALAWGQLATGGWKYDIDFDPDQAAKRHHRRDVEPGRTDPGDRYHTTTFDDDNSQSALRFIMSYDRVTGFTDDGLRRAVRHGLEHFLAAQYPNGAWPQRYDGPYDPDDWPVLPARYPESWSRTWHKPDYKHYYTLNDATIPDMITTLLLAWEIYGVPAHLDAAKKGGDFLILAQMPEPQPAWAQQYDSAMTPSWARRFEPPAIVSHESISAMQALMELFVATGHDKYREPIPRALAWLERSGLPDGRHARFYELQTNRPLYFTKKYKLVYTDDDLPTHYAFKTRINLAALHRQFADLDRARDLHDDRRPPPRARTGRGDVSPDAVRNVIDTLDERGRWVEDGFIESATFNRNVDLLSRYLAPRPAP